ncbi:hypothetical protein A6R68_23213 [Neotoma lepida]|uniref:Uncharacterized protein n=1 Tax=Neotoma lepida TaxID=56216 RepID=A0A1A6HWG7_NEOLE|nr:hypothetical protein A6R68_23213 [Neotoma lepida]
MSLQDHKCPQGSNEGVKRVNHIHQGTTVRAGSSFQRVQACDLQATWGAGRKVHWKEYRSRDGLSTDTVRSIPKNTYKSLGSQVEESALRAPAQAIMPLANAPATGDPVCPGLSDVGSLPQPSSCQVFPALLQS